MEKTEPLYIADWNVKWWNNFGKTMWDFFKNLKVEFKLQYDPAISVLGTYQETWKGIHIKTYTEMFLVTLFIVAKKEEIIQMFSNWWMDKWNVIYLHNTITFGHKKWYSTDTTNSTWKHHAMWK